VKWPGCKSLERGRKPVNWGSVDGFFHMGGYGLFVWGSYGVGLLCIALEVIALRVRARRLARTTGGEA